MITVNHPSIQPGRLYRVTLPDGSVVVLHSHPHPFGELQLLCLGPLDQRAFGLNGVVLYGDVDDIPALAELTVPLSVLEPADDMAQAAWIYVNRASLPCARCGATTPAAHHPLCHTPEGIPLYPDYATSTWLREVLHDLDAAMAWDNAAFAHEFWPPPSVAEVDVPSPLDLSRQLGQPGPWRTYPSTSVETAP